MKIATILLLICLLYNLVIAQQISEMHAVGKGKLLPDELIDKNKKDANGEVCSGLIILSDLEGLTYDSYNGIVALNHQPGRDLLFLSPDERVVTIFKNGYQPLKLILLDYDIRLESGKVYQVSVTGKKKLDLIPVNIKSIPQGARIYIDDVFKGTKITQQVSADTHKIKLELDGFKILDTSIVASENNTLFEFVLKKLIPTQITIKSNPETATILIYDSKGNRINNNYQETTNLQIFLTEGTYKVKLTKFGYREIDTTISVKQNVKQEVLYNLIKEAGNLTIKVNPEGAVVSIDQREVKDLNNIELTPGTHIINVSKDGYEAIDEILDIQRNQQLVKEFSLKAFYGSLQITIKPIDAKVKLTRDQKVISEWTGSNRIDTLVIGTYSLEAKAAGYRDYADKNIVIEKDGLFTKDIKLETDNEALKISRIVSEDKILSNMDFSMEAGKCTITYDLTGEADQEYKVKLYLLDDKDRSFGKELSEITGDIGKGKFSGKGRRIQWNYTKEFPGKLNSDNLYLKLEAGESGGNTWYYVIGTAILGGGAAYFLMPKGKDEPAQKTTPPTSSIPDQPDRP